MTRYALVLQYDGSGFNGWQAQPYGRTIQIEIEDALKILTREDFRITASGRTDAGVHALEQVVHFDLEKKNDLGRIVRGLNGILKNDITVKNAYVVDNDFHSRFSAKSREYLYLIYNDFTPSPFIQKRALWVPQKLNINYLNEIASHLVGEHDFKSFCKKISAENGTIRSIESVTFTREKNLIQFNIKGNAFLHNMIRIIIGTVLEMHEGGKSAEYVDYILSKKDRDFAGKTASPVGLYLKKVSYDPKLASFESAF